MPGVSVEQALLSFSSQLLADNRCGITRCWKEADAPGKNNSEIGTRTFAPFRFDCNTGDLMALTNDALPKSAGSLPPGPKSRLPWGHLIPLMRDPLKELTQGARTYGDFVTFRIRSLRAFLINDPDSIRDMFITQNAKMIKGPALQNAKRLLGEGLLTSEGEFHRRQRRLAQPAFQPRNISHYAETMVEHAARLREEWQPGDTVDIEAEMRRLTLGIVAKTLFGAEAGEEAGEIGEALTNAMVLLNLLSLPFAQYLERMPFPAVRRFERDRDRLDDLIRGMIRDRRANPGGRTDLLSLLLIAQDEEGTGGMTDTQVRDEVMTLFLAGHETMAVSMSWTWHLLSQNPEAEARLHAELDEVLEGRLPEHKDLERLVYTERVFAEAMRVFPPAWAVSRVNVEEVEFGGYRLPARSMLIASQYVMHRDPRFYPDPLRFDPDRWIPEAKAARPRFSYFPFGGGPRNCIGEGFAWMEGTLLLATLAQKWRLRTVPGHPIVLQPLITLRPKHGIRMTLEPNPLS